MFHTCFLALTLGAPAPKDAPFSLHTNPPPKEWRIEEINDGLPLRWEKGTVQVLAWEVIADNRPHEYTQILVLKRFDKPTEDSGHKWVLTHLYRDPANQQWPWRGPLRIPPPVPPGGKLPRLTDAQLFGWEFYDELPTEEQVTAFLNETMWTPRLGTEKASFSSGEREITTKLSAGGIDRAIWKKVFDRDVPTRLFPELQKAAENKK
jgi:hypothetical protein